MALKTPVAWELRPVQLADRDTFAPYLSGCPHPISDYTFAQVYGWRTALNLWWRVIDGHLCVFANGSNLSLLMPPLAPAGTPGLERALRRACEVMHDYNAELAADAGRGAALVAPRVESVSEALLARMPEAGYAREPLGADYVYDVRDMIELAGGAFKSKRHDRNHFMRAWRWRVEPFDVRRHLEPCARLLELWHHQSDANHAGEDALCTLKRRKETLAAAAQMLDADALGLTGLCVWVDGGADDPGAGGGTSNVEHRTSNVEVQSAPVGSSSESASSTLDVRHSMFDVQADAPRLVAFTLGEPLGLDMSSILVEKAHRDYRGLAQFVFSEFCRACWADRPFVNAGDDWGVETLARTKQSYRPVKMLPKFALTRLRPVSVFLPAQPATADTRWAQRLQSACAPYQPLAPMRQPLLPVIEDSLGCQTVPPLEPERLTIRAAELADLPAALALEQQCFTDAFPLSRRQLRRFQQSRTAIFVVAAREAAGSSQVVGDGIALLRRHPGRGAGAPRLSGRIYTIAVDPGERGRGTGRRLLEALLEQLRLRGVSRVFLEVAADNVAAIRLYEDAGFTTRGMLRDYYGPGRDALHMTRPLEASTANVASQCSPM